MRPGDKHKSDRQYALLYLQYYSSTSGKRSVGDRVKQRRRHSAASYECMWPVALQRSRHVPGRFSVGSRHVDRRLRRRARPLCFTSVCTHPEGRTLLGDAWPEWRGAYLLVTYPAQADAVAPGGTVGTRGHQTRGHGAEHDVFIVVGDYYMYDHGTFSLRVCAGRRLVWTMHRKGSGI
jgi:hypothetical protein